jgi:hypothetical protein
MGIITIRKVILMPNQKEAAFIRIRNARLPRAIKAIELIGNLSNRGNYRYSEDQAIQIVREIDLARDSLARSFKIDQSDRFKPDLAAKSGAQPPDVTIEGIDPIARSWVAWALDKLLTGDRSTAIDMLKKGLQLERGEKI